MSVMNDVETSADVSTRGGSVSFRHAGATAAAVAASFLMLAVKLGVRLSRAARKRLLSGKALALTVEARQAGARTRTTSILLPGVKS